MLGAIPFRALRPGGSPQVDSPGGLSGALTSLQNTINQHPGAYATRGGLTLFVLLVALVGGRWLGRLASRVPISAETKFSREGKDQGKRVRLALSGFSRWLGRLTLLSVWVAALVAVAYIWFFNQTLNPTTQRELGNTLRSLGVHIGLSLLILACTLGLGRLLQRGMVASLAGSHIEGSRLIGSRVNENLIRLGGRLIYTATLVIGLIIILGVWGTGIVVPVALIGTLTVALSLALQDVLKNLVAGVYLLLEHPFIIYDRIAMGAYEGIVEDIQIRYTELRTDDGQRVLIPNSMLFSSVVVNLSQSERKRAGIAVTVPDSGADGFDRAQEQIQKALERVVGVIKDPAPRINVNSVAGGKLELHVVFWLASKNASASPTVFSDVIEEVRAQLSDAEVTVLDAAALSV